MATQKPISTISYNSEAFLKEKLDTWLNAHIIQAYQFIKHIGEDDDKDHIHLRVEPNKKLDPMELTEQLKEYVVGNDKPLGVRPWRHSKEEDWFLYAVHDKDYLHLHYGGGEKGEKLPYEWQQIVVPDNYDLEIAFVRAKASLNHTSVNMASRLRQGEGALNLILQGENPYLVNALLRTITATDYERVVSELEFTKKQLYSLSQSIIEQGFVIEANDNGELFAKKIN